jgi:hypothetical protein
MTSPRFLVVTAVILAGSVTAVARQTPASPAAQAPATAPAAARPERPRIQMDPDRARQLYVSKDPKDHGLGVDFARQIQAKAETDRRYAEAARGLVDFKKVTYRSSVGDMDVPAYLFQPLQKRGANGHAAMVWVHGGVHGLAQAGSRRDEDLRRSGAVGLERRSRLQPPRRPGDVEARRFAGTDRLVEPHLDVLRVAPAAVLG